MSNKTILFLVIPLRLSGYEGQESAGNCVRYKVILWAGELLDYRARFLALVVVFCLQKVVIIARTIVLSFITFRPPSGKGKHNGRHGEENHFSVSPRFCDDAGIRG